MGWDPTGHGRVLVTTERLASGAQLAAGLVNRQSHRSLLSPDDKSES